MQADKIRSVIRYWSRQPLLMAVLAVELLLLLGAAWAAIQPPVIYTFAPDQLEPTGEKVTLRYDENGYYGVTYDIDGQDILQTPPMELVPGNYKATVTYACDPTWNEVGRLHHSNFRLSDPGNGMAVAESRVILREDQNIQTGLLSVRQSTSTARIIFHDDGGKYTIGGITLAQDMGYAALCAWALLLVFLALDMVLLHLVPGSPLYCGTGAAAAAVILTGAVVLASVPLLTDGVDLMRVDCIYHLQRIEGIAQGLRDGQFPVRLNSAAKNGYGYANSLFYGEMLLYIPAVLRLLGGSVQAAYKVYAIGLQAATAFLAYRCFHPIFGRIPALAGAVIYLLSPYRLRKLYEIQALGEYAALTFLPIIVYGLWLMYHETTPVAHRKAVLVLTFGYSALLQCHMITTLLAVLAGATVALIQWRTTFRSSVLLRGCQAGGLTILLNLWFLLPFVTAMATGLYQSVESGNIQGQGLSLTRLLDLEDTSSAGVAMLACGGCALCILVALGSQAGSWRRVCGIALAVGGAALYLSTNLFPWNLLDKVPVAGALLQVIQFPWRYGSIATIALVAALMAAAKMLCQKKRLQAAGAAMLAGCVLFTAASGAQYQSGIVENLWTDPVVDISQLYYENPYDRSSNIRLALDTLYLPQGAQQTQDGFSFEHIVTSVNLGEFSWSDGVTSVTYDEYLGQDGHIEFPYLYYPGYRVVEGEGTVFPTANGMVGVLVPANSSGTLSIAYREPLRWRLADLISAGTLLALAGWKLFRIRRRKAADRSGEMLPG